MDKYIGTYLRFLKFSWFALYFSFERLAMHKIPDSSNINRKHAPLLSFTFYKIFSFCDSTLPRRNHEVLPYCLVLFLFCDPAGMDVVLYTTVKILFSVATRFQLWVYKVQIFFPHGSRDSGDSGSGEEWPPLQTYVQKIEYWRISGHWRRRHHANASVRLI